MQPTFFVFEIYIFARVEQSITYTFTTIRRTAWWVKSLGGHLVDSYRCVLYMCKLVLVRDRVSHRACSFEDVAFKRSKWGQIFFFSVRYNAQSLRWISLISTASTSYQSRIFHFGINFSDNHNNQLSILLKKKKKKFFNTIKTLKMQIKLRRLGQNFESLFSAELRDERKK